jgi:hypothetical protein
MSIVEEGGPVFEPAVGNVRYRVGTQRQRWRGSAAAESVGAPIGAAGSAATFAATSQR